VQRDAVAAIVRAGGSVKYDWEVKDGRPNPRGKPVWPKWLVDHLGPDYFAHVAVAELAQGGVDEQMVPVEKLRHLDTLVLRKSSITGAGLAHLERLADLRRLAIFYSQVSEGGMEHLGRLPRLESLSFRGTNIGDAGLAHLRGLTHLR